MAHNSSINSDNRRRTMEVSATMLRDILIGYKETDGKGDVSFDDRLTNDTRNRGNTEQPFPNDRAKSEEKSRRLKDSLQNDNRSSLNRNSINIILEPTVAIANINHSNSFSSSSRQKLYDTSRIKHSRRYSPRQGSTGSDVSIKSHSEDSIGSEDGSSNSTDMGNLQKRQNQSNNSNTSNAANMQIHPSSKATTNLLPSILTSSPLIDRKQEQLKSKVVTKKPPYYVGDTCNNRSNNLNNSSCKEDTIPSIFQHNQYKTRYNPFLSASSLEIPYEEVFAHLSMQMTPNSGDSQGQDFVSLQKNSVQCCGFDQSSHDENPLYDESLYRLLPNVELARACPNPMYCPDGERSNVLPQFQYYNIEETPVDKIAPELQKLEEQGFIRNSQRHHQEQNVCNSLAYSHGSSAFRYENINLPHEIGNDNLISAISEGGAMNEESEKLNYDTFQRRIRAYHPTQMQSNHHRGRNEQDHQFLNRDLFERRSAKCNEAALCVRCAHHNNFSSMNNQHSINSGKQRQNFSSASLPYPNLEKFDCICREKCAERKLPTQTYNQNDNYPSTMKEHNISGDRSYNHVNEKSDFNASDALSSMMIQHFELNRQINGNYLNDSFATSSSFSPYIPANSASSAKPSSLSKSMLNKATTAQTCLNSFQETDDHVTVTNGDGTKSISFDYSNEPLPDNTMSSSIGCEEKNIHLLCTCAKVREGVSDALDASILSKQKQHDMVCAYQHVACATSETTKTLQSGFESGAEHFCYAPNIKTSDNHISENYNKITNFIRDDKFSVDSPHLISADCECIENSSTCAVPYLQPRCATNSTLGLSLQQDFPLAHNIIASNTSYSGDDSENRSQSLIQPLQLRLGSDETQQLSLATKYEESENERRRLYDLVNNHCDQLKRFFNLVSEERYGELENGNKEVSSDIIAGRRNLQENEIENSMVLKGENLEWQEGNGTNMLGIKQGAVSKHSSAKSVKGRDSSVVNNNLSSSATDSHTDSSLWSTNEKALKSLAKLKLDIPRVNTNGTSVHNSSNKPEDAQKSNYPKDAFNGVRHKNEVKYNEFASNPQKGSITHDNQRNAMHLHHHKRSLNQIQQQQQYFHRCHGRRGQGAKSGQLLRATIAHKIDIGTIRQHNMLQQKETIYTAWDNHHSPNTTSESVGSNNIPYPLNCSYDGPSSLPSYNSNEIPRAPIPTPDDIIRIKSNRSSGNNRSNSANSNGHRREKSEVRKGSVPKEILSSNKQSCSCASSDKEVKMHHKHVSCPTSSFPVTFINSGAVVNSNSGSFSSDHKPRNAVSRGDTVRHGHFRRESKEKHVYDSPTGSSSNSSPAHRHRPMMQRQATMDKPLTSSDISSADISFNVDTTFSSPNQSHYQTPKDRDGDYSYAYDSSVSPAFIIKYNDAIDGEEDEYDLEQISESLNKNRQPSGGKNLTNNVENIYEEIRDVKSPSKTSRSASHDDDRSSRKSSSVNSDSGIGGFGNKPPRSSNTRYNQGTLDIVNSKSRKEKRAKGIKNDKEDSGNKSNSSSSNSGATSALDNLLFQTAPGMTPNQRRNLRKSLVDEVFEELVQRHHDRVLQQLRLDVEDFIAPDSSDMIDEPEISNKPSKESHRSSSASSPSSRLKKCESMDFKDVASVSSRSSSTFGNKNIKTVKDKSTKSSTKPSNKKSKNSEGRDGFKLSFLASAKRYGEAINRKYFAKPSKSKDITSTNEQKLEDGRGSVRLREKGSNIIKPRPLSALLLSSSLSKSSHIISNNPNADSGVQMDNHLEVYERKSSNTDDLLAKHSSSHKQKEISRSKSTGVSLARRNSDFDSIDSDEEVPSRRLQRSKIIASFLEQLDNNAVDDDFGDSEENGLLEHTSNNTSASLNNNNNNNDLKKD